MGYDDGVECRAAEKQAMRDLGRIADAAERIAAALEALVARPAPTPAVPPCPPFVAGEPLRPHCDTSHIRYRTSGSDKHTPF